MHFKHLPGTYDGTILKQGVIYESCKVQNPLYVEAACKGVNFQ